MRRRVMAAAVALAGCATVGRPIDPALVQQLRPGATTREEAVAMFGPPKYEISQGDGTITLMWQHATYVAGTVNGQSLQLRFDPAGKLLEGPNGITHVRSNP